MDLIAKIDTVSGRCTQNTYPVRKQLRTVKTQHSNLPMKPDATLLSALVVLEEEVRVFILILSPFLFIVLLFSRLQSHSVSQSLAHSLPYSFTTTRHCVLLNRTGNKRRDRDAEKST